MHALRGFLTFAVCLALLVPAAAAAGKKEPTGSRLPTCNLPESNAEGLVILSNVYPGYWWDHTNPERHCRAAGGHRCGDRDVVEHAPGVPTG